MTKGTSMLTINPLPIQLNGADTGMVTKRFRQDLDSRDVQNRNIRISHRPWPVCALQILEHAVQNTGKGIEHRNVIFPQESNLGRGWGRGTRVAKLKLRVR